MNPSKGRKTIFITGAASGMGRATANLFFEKGWYIGAYDVNAGGLEKLRSEFGEENCITGVLDVTDRAAYKRANARSTSWTSRMQTAPSSPRATAFR